MIYETFSFEDILIKPAAYSRVRSRSMVDTSVTLHGGVTLKLPLISASMSLFDTVSPYDDEPQPYLGFAIALAEAGGMHIFSRGVSFNKRISAVSEIKDMGLNVGIAVGLDEFLDNQKMLETLGVLVSIDIANGSIIDTLKWNGEKPLVVGNFANELVSRNSCNVSSSNYVNFKKRFEGNIILKYGIGNGAACSTRLTTGVGYPQAGLLYSVKNSDYPIISDGGISTIGDFCKAIALGADLVMTGRLLGHARETPWSLVHINGDSYKPYRGMASREEKRSKKFVEGASGHIPFFDKSVQEIVYDFLDGLKSAMSYCDAFTIDEFIAKAEFIKSPSAVYENQVRLVKL
jgi:IMP dehydrogenase